MADRALAYMTTVDEIRPLEGYDKVEYVRNKGWWCVCAKGMHVGDKAIYFEIDSLLPMGDHRFDFMEKYKYRVKTQRMCKVISQGLLMPVSEFPDLADLPVGTDLTQRLGITYYVPEDNKRKATVDPNAKYRSMAARHRKLFSTPVIRWMMRRECGKKLLFKFFGKKRTDDKAFPTKFAWVHKTDEDRVELRWEFIDKKVPYIVTTKVDGTSSTFLLERVKSIFGNRYEYYVCSRNVRQLNENQDCYHDTNVYWEMSNKYHLRTVLQDILDRHPDWDYVCLQGETAGPDVQGNPHKLKERQLFGFNFIDSEHGRWDSLKARDLMAFYHVPWVPIVDTYYMIPDTLEEFKLAADGPCEIPGSSGLREGYVYRKKDDPNVSFKNVSNQYLLNH